MKSICHAGYETSNTHLFHSCDIGKTCLLGTWCNTFLGAVRGYHSQVIRDAS